MDKSNGSEGTHPSSGLRSKKLAGGIRRSRDKSNDALHPDRRLRDNLDKGIKPCCRTAGMVEQVERSHPVQRDPAEHGKSTLASIDVILRVVHQGICLPQCRPLFDGSFPEGQGARHSPYDKVHGVLPSQILMNSLVHRRLIGTLTFSFVQNT